MSAVRARRAAVKQASAPRSPRVKSRLTNVMGVLPGCDGRSTWARRFRDLIQAHLNDLGGDDVVSEAQRSIVRRAATLTTELERLEQRFALAGEALPAELGLYQTTANSLRRLLESLGIKRASPRDITPSLGEYLENRETLP